MQGRTDGGVALLQSVVEPLRVEQLNIVLAPTLRAYAEGLACMGDRERSEAIIWELIDRAETTSPTFLLPELLRTQADVMLACRPDDLAGAEAGYRRAIARAKSDGALGWELRAANSLASLLIRARRPEEACSLLERTLSAFTEGFGVGDLAQAEALLQSSRRPLHR